MLKFGQATRCLRENIIRRPFLSVLADLAAADGALR